MSPGSPVTNETEQNILITNPMLFFTPFAHIVHLKIQKQDYEDEKENEKIHKHLIDRTQFLF